MLGGAESGESFCGRAALCESASPPTGGREAESSADFHGKDHGVVQQRFGFRTPDRRRRARAIRGREGVSSRSGSRQWASKPYDESTAHPSGRGDSRRKISGRLKSWVSCSCPPWTVRAFVPSAVSPSWRLFQRSKLVIGGTPPSLRRKRRKKERGDFLSEVTPWREGGETACVPRVGLGRGWITTLQRGLRCRDGDRAWGGDGDRLGRGRRGPRLGRPRAEWLDESRVNARWMKRN